jgi:hypothetical protein|tara:strand:+ start:1212 stop:1631 length:420 start_codon:yes stop_codon:yes gene_type:complete
MFNAQENKMILRHLPSIQEMTQVKLLNVNEQSAFYIEDVKGNKLYKKHLPVNKVNWVQVNNPTAGEDGFYLSLKGMEDVVSIVADYNKGEKLQDERGCAYHVWYNVTVRQYYDNDEQVETLSTRCLYKALSFIKQVTGV